MNSIFVNVAALILISIFISVLWWVNDSEAQCEWATNKVRAVAFCMEDIECLLTSEDYLDAEFYMNRQDEHCEEINTEPASDNDASWLHNERRL